MQLPTFKTQAGFTIIEMVVSLALFTTVVVVSIGALLTLLGVNDDLQGEQSVMSNLSFALDSMTREIRTGTYYYCTSATAPSGVFAGNLDALGDNVRDCASGNSVGRRLHGVSFKEAGDSITGNSVERIMYYFDDREEQIFRKVGSRPAQPIVASGITVRNADFFVTGTEPVEENGTNAIQPAVTIYIEAVANDDPDEKSYYLQTTITQRILDI